MNKTGMSRSRFAHHAMGGSRWIQLCCGAVVLGLASLSAAGSSGLADRVIEHKLANGLTVLLVERHQAPVVSINMTFGVGGVNEQAGQTGLAHLYEHMAFKGTRTVGTTTCRMLDCCSIVATRCSMLCLTLFS